MPNDEPQEWVPVPEIRYAGELEIKAEYRKEPSWKAQKEPSQLVLSLVNRFLDARR